jgi:hypothetical protein
MPRPPRKPFFRPLALRLFGTQRKRIIGGALVLVLTGGVVTASVLSSQAATDQKVAIALANKEAAAEAKREAAAEAVRVAKLDLKNAQDEAGASFERSVGAAAAASSYAEPEALLAVKVAQDALAALSNREADASTDELVSAASALDSAVSTLGTAADAADRAYIAAETASGRSFTDKATIIRLARELCKNLDANYASDTAKAVDRFLDNPNAEDVIAVTVYCPPYLPAINAVAAMIPGDGGYAVGASATAFGIQPQVIAAGTYSTRGAVSDCYWEVNDNHGGILRNNFILSAQGGVSVQVRAGQGFTTRGCGAWVRR